MNVVGIIAEYNPFHNGHRYQLEQSIAITKADFSVAVMSGDFTQRGQPAFIDKWTRAEMAVENGIDLVIELPFVFACNNAEYFARGGISILSRLGCITHFSFGSEEGKLEPLLDCATLLQSETDEFRQHLRTSLDQGLSYPKARYEALCRGGNKEAAQMLLSPNNILAVEYLKQWLRTEKEMIPVTVKRIGSGYHDLALDGQSYPSATAIRRAFQENEQPMDVDQALPLPSRTILKRLESRQFLTGEDFYELLVYRILSADRSELAGILSSGEGLENRMKDAVKKSKDAAQLIQAIKSKRYTETRICRLLAHMLMGLQREDFFKLLEKEILYARILGHSKKGAELLRIIKKEERNQIPILSNINKEVGEDRALKSLLSYVIKASDLCNLLRRGELYTNSDHVRSPYRKS